MSDETVVVHGAKTKGYIKNLKTNIIKSFMYNPTSFSTSRTVSFGELTSPGISYPKFQYIAGQVRTISIQIFLNGEPSSVVDYVGYYEGLLPSEKSGDVYNAPPVILFAFGSFIKKCLVESVNTEYMSFTDTLQPKTVIITLSMKVVA